MRKDAALRKVLQARDVCLFCTFRPRLTLRPRLSQLPHQSRTLSSTHSKKSGQAAAVKQDDEDDVSFSLLKQNAGLAKAFPSRTRPTPTPNAGTNQQIQGDSPTIRPDGQRRLGQELPQERQGNRYQNSRPYNRNNSDLGADGGRQTQNSNRPFPTYRRETSNNNYRSSTPGQPFAAVKSFIPQQDAEPGSNVTDRRDTRPARPNRFSRQDQASSTSFNRDNSEQDRLAIGGSKQTQPRSEYGQNRSNRPTRDSDKPVARNYRNQDDRQSQFQPRSNLQENGSGNMRAQGMDGVRDGRWQPMQQSTASTDGYRPGRNVSASTSGNTARSRNPNNSNSPNRSRGQTPATASKPSTTVEAPAGSSFHSSLDEYGQPRRRSDRKEKRSTRADRLSSEEESNNTSSKTSAASRTRERSFDYEAWEEEALLNPDGQKSKKREKKKKVVAAEENARPTLQLPEFISVEKLAKLLKVGTEKFVEHLEEEGFEGARYDHVLDSGTSAMFAEIYGFEPVVASSNTTQDLVARPVPEDVSEIPPRPPIVTIMGHVDHGKTTILDYLRKSSVVDTEHGGITQHIGAFSVTMPGTNRQITFLDTPGHAAFLEMRRRGANVTDIVVLVVAADDSVKPQTIEAIKHALEARVQLIVAINKVDKEDANIERVKQDLARHDVVVEDYGGDYQVIPVSGKTGQGMTDLEEAIITLADVNDYRAEIDGPAEGSIIESKVTLAGRIATVLIRRGTLRPGDFIVAGTTWARVRTLRNDAGTLVTEAPPGMPVQVDGWRGEDPTAGLEVLQAESEQQAKDVVDLRLEIQEAAQSTSDMTAYNSTRSAEAEARAKVLAWEAEQNAGKSRRRWRKSDNEGWVEVAEDESGPRKVHFLVKADVAGSVEAVVSAVSAIGNNEIAANVIHSGTGELTESDIRRLATTGESAYAITFNQPVDVSIHRLAEAANVKILDQNIIYRLTDEVKVRLADELPPIVTQKVIGEAEVGQVFEVTYKKKKSKVAGCKITNGTITRSNKVRVIRGTTTVFTGSLASLKNVKKDVTEMKKGTECGMSFDEEWEDFQPGDQIQSFEEHEEKRKLY